MCSLVLLVLHFWRQAPSRYSNESYLPKLAGRYSIKQSLARNCSRLMRSVKASGRRGPIGFTDESSVLRHLHNLMLSGTWRMWFFDMKSSSSLTRDDIAEGIDCSSLSLRLSTRSSSQWKRARGRSRIWLESSERRLSVLSWENMEAGTSSREEWLKSSSFTSSEWATRMQKHAWQSLSKPI